MVHDALDRWLDQLETTGGGTPTLLELSEQFMATRLTVLGPCLEAVLRERYAAELAQIEAPCVTCGRRLARHRLDTRTVSTLQGTITLTRPYFYCNTCRVGFHPLDATLGLAPERHQYDIQARTTRVGADLPYEVSEDQFEHLTGIRASSHFIHETLNAVGETATLERVLPDADEIATRIETARDGRRRRPVLVVACDGAHAPTRPPGGRTTKRGPGEWREVKGFRLYLLGPEGRIVHVASWHQIADKAALSEALGVVATRIPHDRVRIALVADGSDWIWDVFQTHFPEGEPVLDYYHCAERVHETARAQYGEGTLEAQEWAEATLTRLCDNDVGAVIGGLLRMKPRSPPRRRLDSPPEHLSRRAPRPGRLPGAATTWAAARQRRGRIRKQADVSRPAQTVRRVVAHGEWQRDAAHPLRDLQRHVRPPLRRLHGHPRPGVILISQDNRYGLSTDVQPSRLEQSGNTPIHCSRAPGPTLVALRQA